LEDVTCPSSSMEEQSIGEAHVQNTDSYYCVKSIRLPRDRRCTRWSSIERSPHCDPTGCKYPDGALTKIAGKQLMGWMKSGGLDSLVAEVLQRRSEMNAAICASC
jgi:hypothetical protein